MAEILRVGTRASLLATTQTGTVIELLKEHTDSKIELVPIHSDGDLLTGPLATIGGTGIFAARLRQALLDGEIDIAVHSLKDLPTAEYPGLVLAAVPERVDVRDVLITRDGATLAELPRGSRIGTGAPRRAAALKRMRPDLQILDIRGNVDTRIAKVDSGEYDGAVLAAAGVLRIGRQTRISQFFEFSEIPHAPGQGALAVEASAAALADNPDLAELLNHIDSPEARVSAGVERELLAVLEAGCTAPIGAHGELRDGSLILSGVIFSDDGSEKVEETVSVPFSGFENPAETIMIARHTAEEAGRILLAALSSSS